MPNENEMRDYVKSLYSSKSWAEKVAIAPFNQIFAIYMKYKDKKDLVLAHPNDNGKREHHSAFDAYKNFLRRTCICGDCGTIFPVVNDSDYTKKDADGFQLYCICPECCGLAMEV